MRKVNDLVTEFESGKYDDKLQDIYIDKLSYQRARYADALRAFADTFGDAEVEIYSAPGRTEVCGNHTDHQHGEVLAASINDDVLAIVAATDKPMIRVLSKGYDMIEIGLGEDSLKRNPAEEGTTKALIRGVLASAVNKGYKIGGFNAYITSDVLGGSGLSSSAAFETAIGTILSGLYNDMTIDPVQIAIMGQYAENVFFGKPCGLMDQMASSVGSLCHIDFANPDEPVVERIDFDFDANGYSLCITDTKGSHADLTADYAAVPAEMKSIAASLGKEYLHDVDRGVILQSIAQLRDEFGDRAVMRALHFYAECTRVHTASQALKDSDLYTFLECIKESGDSSFKFLQNVYTSADIAHQNVSLALMLSEEVLGLGDNRRGVCRVHGGGFAGTIQAFVKNDTVDEYKAALDAVYGEGACAVLKIRKYGGIKVL